MYSLLPRISYAPLIARCICKFPTNAVCKYIRSSILMSNLIRRTRSSYFTPQRRLTENPLPNLEGFPAAFGGAFPSTPRITLATACIRIHVRKKSRVPKLFPFFPLEELKNIMALPVRLVKAIPLTLNSYICLPLSPVRVNSVTSVLQTILVFVILLVHCLYLLVIF